MITRCLVTLAALLGFALAPDGARAAPPPPGPFSTRVFATREGLTGETTANGHVIDGQDLFAALPSRLGLAAASQGGHTVQVCTAARCVFVPVWDVGPWNIHDDYWNAARQMFADLPRGRPAAEAAYIDGYNRGRDEFGRTVANPAGIDLADRAFWDGLGLTTNSWVTVTFLWTGAGPRGTVATDGSPLLVRDAPTTRGRIVGLAAASAQLPISCQVTGEQVSGNARSTNLWSRVAPGMYVSHAFVATASSFSAPQCL
ncbi:hypothetical protein [Hamadaea tsunoensis]|uniref:hypothetical protein n=1 Tax=Hamadaea tsunoensis TaxID=53368 RepID=UPI0012FC4437|nr:hypothetical protein [Hamadaea tsunoensis]